MGTYNILADVQSYTLTGVAADIGYGDYWITTSVTPFTMTGVAAGTNRQKAVSAITNFTLSAVDPLEGTWLRAVVASDTTDMSYALQGSFGQVMSESVDVSLGDFPQTTYGVVSQEALELLSSVLPYYGMSLADAANITPVLTPAFGVLVAETVDLAQTHVASATYGLILVDSMEAQDALNRAIYALGADSVNVSLGSVALYRAVGALAETVEITVAHPAQMSLAVTLSDDVEVSPTEALQWIFSPVLLDGVEIGGIYLSPGDGVTTWAMNTRNGAVTEYTNYAFNSFARMGRKYIGATADGLYELVGDDDAGTDIIAELKGGMLQIAGSRFSSFKAAYLGMTGAGTVYLKLDAGDGRSYTYQVTAKDDETTKVRLGKGLRARYFTYTLTTAGQDFDLDTIEFIPIKARRRD